MTHVPQAPAAEETGDTRIEISEAVATLTFGHPKGNSLPKALLRRIASSIDELGADRNVRVLILRSEGSGPFCAGASFDEFSRISSPEEGQEFFMGFASIILAMRRCPQPVITRVHGKVAGGGIGIVSASDYAVASTKASLRLSEIALGIGPFVVGPVIERRVGRGAFTAMAFDADWHDAAWGERHGLYSRVVSSEEELDAAVEELARQLSRANPEAVAELKKIVWEGTDDWERLLQERAALSGRLVLSDYTRRAIEKFRERHGEEVRPGPTRAGR
jgi:methylglutaconyl-CoA hydratase